MSARGGRENGKKIDVCTGMAARRSELNETVPPRMECYG
jgi:hypothetical protein